MQQKKTAFDKTVNGTCVLFHSIVFGKNMSCVNSPSSDSPDFFYQNILLYILFYSYRPQACPNHICTHVIDIIYLLLISWDIFVHFNPILLKHSNRIGDHGSKLFMAQCERWYSHLILSIKHGWLTAEKFSTSLTPEHDRMGVCNDGNEKATSGLWSYLWAYDASFCYRSSHYRLTQTAINTRKSLIPNHPPDMELLLASGLYGYKSFKNVPHEFAIMGGTCQFG